MLKKKLLILAMVLGGISISEGMEQPLASLKVDTSLPDYSYIQTLVFHNSTPAAMTHIPHPTIKGLHSQYTKLIALCDPKNFMVFSRLSSSTRDLLDHAKLNENYQNCKTSFAKLYQETQEAVDKSRSSFLKAALVEQCLNALQKFQAHLDRPELRNCLDLSSQSQAGDKEKAPALSNQTEESQKRYWQEVLKLRETNKTLMKQAMDLYVEQSEQEHNPKDQIALRLKAVHTALQDPTTQDALNDSVRFTKAAEQRVPADKLFNELAKICEDIAEIAGKQTTAFEKEWLSTLHLTASEKGLLFPYPYHPFNNEIIKLPPVFAALMYANASYYKSATRTKGNLRGAINQEYALYQKALNRLEGAWKNFPLTSDEGGWLDYMIGENYHKIYYDIQLSNIEKSFTIPLVEEGIKKKLKKYMKKAKRYFSDISKEDPQDIEALEICLYCNLRGPQLEGNTPENLAKLTRIEGKIEEISDEHKLKGMFRVRQFSGDTRYLLSEICKDMRAKYEEKKPA